MGAAADRGAGGLMIRWPSSYCLFSLHWWEGDDNRACLGVFPLSSWLGRNRCLNGRNIQVWVFKWGYKTQEKEQLEVVDLGSRRWLDLAPDKASKSPLICTLIICPFKYVGQLLLARNEALCWESMVYKTDMVPVWKSLTAYAKTPSNMVSCRTRLWERQSRREQAELGSQGKDVWRIKICKQLPWLTLLYFSLLLYCWKPHILLLPSDPMPFALAL